MESEKKTLLVELKYAKGFLESVNKKLSNERFVNNAPESVVEVEKKKKADTESKIRSLEESLSRLN
jgi:valyl-tRNA synthetase